MGSPLGSNPSFRKGNCTGGRYIGGIGGDRCEPCKPGSTCTGLENRDDRGIGIKKSLSNPVMI